MLPNEEIARQLNDLDSRVERLEKIEMPLGMSLIESQALALAAAAVNFATIPQGFSHLMLLYYVRGDVVATNDILGVQFNGDAGNNYDYLWARDREPTSWLTGEGVATSEARVGIFAGSTAPANVYNGGMIRINHYTNAFGQKTIHSLFDYKIGTTTQNIRGGHAFGYWRNVAAITSLAVVCIGGNFIANSRFDLYGIK